MPAAATAANAKSPTANLRIRTSRLEFKGYHGHKDNRKRRKNVSSFCPRDHVILLTLDEIGRRLQSRTPRRTAKSHFAEAAVALILAPGGSGGWDVLMIRRAEGADHPRS